MTCASNPKNNPTYITFVLRFLGISYTMMDIPIITNPPPAYACGVIISLNSKNAMMNMDGVYIVETSADKLEPIFFNDSKNKRSAMNMPKIPLKIRTYISCEVKFGIGIEKISIVTKNPKTPMEFFMTFNCIALKLFDEMSKNMTADDQQTAVIIA
tara:strand:+ start:95 stop:562 length:468 start_codon:yes stop_codon:yes gene_type:complete